MSGAEVNAPLMTARGLQVGFGRQAILPAVSFELRQGELWALIGRNGSGKSTLIRTVLGLHPKVDGEVIKAPGLRVGYVPQRSNVDLSVPERVIDLVRSGVDTGWSFARPRLSAEQRAAVDEAVATTDLTGLELRAFSSLSEGQKQRALLAKALVSKPQLLILDEPTSAMDFEAEAATFDLLERLRDDRGLSLLVVTHHLPMLATRATHVIHLDPDDDTATAGSVAAIAQDAAFGRRYGDLLKATGEVQDG